MIPTVSDLNNKIDKMNGDFLSSYKELKNDISDLNLKVSDMKTELNERIYNKIDDLEKNHIDHLNKSIVQIEKKLSATAVWERILLAILTGGVLIIVRIFLVNGH